MSSMTPSSTDSVKHTAGPWEVIHWGGGRCVVARTLAGDPNRYETLGCKVYNSPEAARAAIAKTEASNA